MHTMHLLLSVAIQPNLELKTQPKQLLGSLPLVIALAGLYQQTLMLTPVLHINVYNKVSSVLGFTKSGIRKSFFGNFEKSFSNIFFSKFSLEEGSATFTMTTLSKPTLHIMTPRIAIRNVEMTLFITTLDTMSLLCVVYAERRNLAIRPTLIMLSDTLMSELMLSVIMLNAFILSAIMLGRLSLCCPYAFMLSVFILKVITLSVTMLRVIMLSVIMLGDVMLNVDVMSVFMLSVVGQSYSSSQTRTVVAGQFPWL
jgi:hypothetical protein